MPASPQPNGSFLSNIISASYCPPGRIKSKLKTNDPSMSYNCKWFPSTTGWRHRTSPCKNALARASLPPSREDSRGSTACRGRDGQGSGEVSSPTRHSAQDDAVTVAEAEAVPNPFPADHSMAAASSAHSPRHLRMPGTPHRPGFTRCNQSPATAAQWARPLKYLIGPLSSPITTLRGV